MRPVILLVSLLATLLAPVFAHADNGDVPPRRDDAPRWDFAAAAGLDSTSTSRGFSTPGDTEDEVEPSLLLSLRYHLTERVIWSVPTLGFAYLGGTPGGQEWIPWGGLTGWGLGYSSIEGLIAQGQLGAGLDVRSWLAGPTALNLTAGATSEFRYSSDCAGEGCMGGSWVPPDRWRTFATAGLTHRLGDAVTINVGAGVAHHMPVGDRLEGPAREAAERTDLLLGSVQTMALRPLPLVQIHVTRGWSIDGYADVALDLDRDRVRQRYLLGCSWIW